MAEAQRTSIRVLLADDHTIVRSGVSHILNDQPDSDDGIGFDPNAVRTDSYGLVSMQERAARGHVALTFVTEPGAGTTIVASWSPENLGLTPSGA